MSSVLLVDLHVCMSPSVTTVHGREWRLDVLQVQNSIFIENNARRGSLKVRLEKCRPLHIKIQVVLVMAEDALKVRFRPEF